MPGQIQAHRAAQGRQMPMSQYSTKLTILNLWFEILALVVSAELRMEPEDLAYDHYAERFERSPQLAIIALLRRWRRQEGILAIGLIALLTERVLEVESVGFGPGDLIPESSRVKSIRSDPTPAKLQVRLLYHLVGDFAKHDCKNSGPWGNELVSYASGSLEVLEASWKMYTTPESYETEL
ncbi:unnamed protein product [Penicillium bialowiezense]